MEDNEKGDVVLRSELGRCGLSGLVSNIAYALLLLALL